MQRIIISIVLFFLANISIADEIRPSYLELNEESPNTYAVLWKVPQKSGQKLSLKAQFPDSCTNRTAITSHTINGATLQRWYINCTNNIVGQRISIEDVDNSNTEVLLRLKWLDGSVSTSLLKPSAPFYIIPEKSTTTDIAITYLLLGTEHILLGVDHLLFVFALLLIVNSTRRLIVTITAFTIAHSITLAGATLGLIHVPQQPVEAVIALSILFLAMEIVHGKRGHPGAAARWPWLVAFIFGLLHGFGFAGALAEVGLPQQAIPLALVFFNVGVELGQLLFVSAVLLLTWLLHRLKQPVLLEKAETVTIYTIGSLSSFWLFERISAF
ncbi:MAG: HupE/UreJ family protein [Gammaproteobacteria bacterium]|nr:HupE/UreJ family protein [Gammaproteobacteria bacterium]